MKSGIRALLAVALISVPLALSGQVTLKPLAGEADLPEAFAPGWKAGDLLLSDGRYLILIGGSPRPMRSTLNSPVTDGKGGILSFVPAGAGLDAKLNIGGPVVRRGIRTVYPGYAGIRSLNTRASGDALSLEAAASYAGQAGEKAGIRTIYSIGPEPGRIDMTSVITNTGAVEIDDLGFSLFFGASSLYAFVPFADSDLSERNFRVVEKDGLSLGWMDPNPRPKGDLRPPGRLLPGESFEVRYSLLADSSPNALLQRIYKTLGIECSPVPIEVKGFPGDKMEIIVRDAVTEGVFYRAFLRSAAACEVPLPAGTYKVTANLFPSVVETFVTVDGKTAPEKCVLETPPMGTLKLRLQDGRGNYLPGKATVIGLAPTKTPYFAPDDPTETGRNWERSKNSCFPAPEGTEIRLASGTYLISASRGPEYAIDQRVVEVLAGDSREHVFRLEKKIDARGFISLDPHLHTNASDGRTGIPERLRSIAAEGVDVAIATDHNVVTDYGPWVKKLGLGPLLAVLRGTEVTPPDFYVHFNVFPFPDKFPSGPDGPVLSLDGDVADLFKRARKAAPEALLQVNHPRSEDLGYFNNARLDTETAAAADRNFSTDFDLLEVMNGPACFAFNDDAVADWLRLLNRGLTYPITGSSDSHSADGGEPGFSRVYVRYDGGKGERLDWKAVAGALKAGRSFVTNGPFVKFEVDGRYTSGDIFTRKPGSVEVHATVQAAPWISLDEVRIIVNGERKAVLPIAGERDATPRFEGTASLTLTRDSYIVVEVLGKESLYPVVQVEGTNVDRDQAAFPYALTNPVFVDVDGNGRFDAPLPGTIGVLPAGDKKAPAQ